MTTHEPRLISMETWPRREAFEFFLSFENPLTSITTPVKVPRSIDQFRKAGNLNAFLVYVVSRAANAMAELKQRIRDKSVVEWDVIHPSIVVLNSKDSIRFCLIHYHDDRSEFFEIYHRKVQVARERAMMLDPDEGRDDVLYISAMPYLNFTGFVHPNPNQPPDSIPRLAWGTLSPDVTGKDYNLPLNFQFHHALLDAIHASRFFDEVQKLLNQL